MILVARFRNPFFKSENSGSALREVRDEEHAREVLQKFYEEFGFAPDQYKIIPGSLDGEWQDFRPKLSHRDYEEFRSSGGTHEEWIASHPEF